jgi:hypothetical protein
VKVVCSSIVRPSRAEVSDASMISTTWR